MRDADGRLASRLKELRTARGWSQHDLAESMRERGWKWSQATMWAIEKGGRPLRAAEAIDLAETFGLSPGEFFTEAATESLEVRRLRAALAQVERLAADARVPVPSVPLNVQSSGTSGQVWRYES